MLSTVSLNLYFLIPGFVLALVAAAIVLPHFVVTSIKDNWGKVPADIDKPFLSLVRIGGIAFLPLWLLAVVLVLFILWMWHGLFMVSMSATMACYSLFPLAAALLVLFLVGLRYDLRGTSSLVRLGTLLVVSALFPLLGFVIDNFFGIGGIYLFPSWLAVGGTIFLGTYLIEMIKLLDGMNGLASGTLTVVLILLLVVNIQVSDVPVVLALGAAVGIILPFWLMKMFRKKWRKVVMGNAGAYVMGFFVVYGFLAAYTYSPVEHVGATLVVAGAILLFPVLDTLRVIGSRARDGRSIIMPDRNQINFKLLRTGMPNGAIFPTYIAMIVLLAATAYILIALDVTLTGTAVAVVALWVVFELVINAFIHRREKHTHQAAWDRVYGRQAWEATSHSAALAAKEALFGTLGIEEEHLAGDDDAFIADSMTLRERFVKRATDIVVAGLSLVLFSPLFLLCYLLIKIDDGKQVLYRQERIGRFGRPFNILKFRTMHLDAEEQGPQLSGAQGENDPRLTKIGRFLRAHHLDELPQLWNVFRGDMTLVGYRPERKYYIEQIMAYDPRYAFLYQIRPGITSYATLYNGYTDTMAKMLRRLELDLYYLAHRSWWVDSKLLFLTFVAIACGKKF